MNAGRWNQIIILALTAATSFALPAIAQPTADSPHAAASPVSTQPLPPIRRIYVPARDLDPEARGLLPLRRAEFERRWATLQATSQAASTPPYAILSSAIYRATLRGESLVQGAAELHINRVAAKESGASPVWLDLAPCNLALGSPSWQASGEDASTESVIWGQVADGRVLVALPTAEAESAGVLQLPWSLRGKRADRGELVFDLKLPYATQQVLDLNLPVSWKLRSPGARIQAPAGTVGTPNEAVWRVELPSHGRAVLHIESAQAAEQLPPLVLVRETGNYVFSPGQVDLELSFELDIDRTPLREIRVKYDPRLRWSAIRWGEQALAWTIEASTTELVAIISLPEPLLGNSRLIQLTAVADWTPSAQRWTLPRASIEGAIWQEGRANVAAPRWLQLDAQAGPGAKLSATSLASGPQGADLLQFQFERATAAIDVQQAPLAQPLETTSLTMLQVEPKQIIAQVVVEVSAAAGSPFTLDCEVPRAWLLESLDAVPADQLEDRVVRSRGNVQLATLQLKQPLRAGKPLRFTARLRHIRSSGEEAWNDDILQPLRVLPAVTARRYVTLQLADASFEPRLLDANGLEFLAPASLPAAVRGMSEIPLGNWVVQLTEPARHPRFMLAAGSPRYAAETVLAIDLGQKRAECKLHIHCQPDSSAVSRLLVQLRPAPAEPPQWRLVGDARPLTAERQAGQPAPDEATGTALYRLELPRSRDAAFTVEASWVEPVERTILAPLPDLPEAAAHTSLIEIRGPVDAATAWQAERLRPLPIPVTGQPIRARYRFQSGQDARLKLLPSRETERPLAGWIARCEIVTEFAASGAARHEARYDLAGGDVDVFEVRLAENVRLARAVVDGRDVLAYSRPSDPRWLSVPLRGDDGQPLAAPRVRLEYTTPAAVRRGWFGSQWTALLPETRLPVLQSYWQARLPSGWRSWTPGGSAPANSLALWGEGELSLLSLFQPSPAGLTLVRDLPQSGIMAVEVYSAAWLGLLALTTGLIASAAGLWLGRSSIVQLCSVALALLAISLLVFIPWRLFVEAAAAGWLAGLACVLINSALKPIGQPSTPTSTNFVLHSARLWALLILGAHLALGYWVLISTPQHVAAQEKKSDNAGWRVVIPVDDEQRPTNFVYVSPGLYDALHRASVLGGVQPDWLIRAAQYELRWQSASADGPGELRGVLAQYEVEVLHERSQLRLPFLRDQVRLTDPGVRIDGEAAAANWTEAGDALLIDLPHAGRRRVEVGLALASAPKAGTGSAQLQIPPLNNSRVLAPPLAPGEQLTLPDARGAEVAGIGGSSQFELGASTSLNIQWSSKAAGPAPVVEADQWLLWRLRPNSVVVDGKWQFRPLTGKIREVIVRADPRYRLLPASNASTFARQWTEEGEVNLHHFVLEDASSADVPLSASFLLVGSTGVGSLNPPRLEGVADRVRNDWQGVSLASGLQWTGKPGMLPVAEFLQAWGDTATAPTYAWRVTPEAPRPPLTVTASVPRMQVEEQIDWSLASNHVSGRIRFVSSQSSPLLQQLRFALPTQWSIRRVELTQSGESIPTRWVRHGDGMLSIIVDEVHTGAWQLELLIDRAHVTGKPTTLPVLVNTELDVIRYECVLRERPGALATLGKVIGWQPAPELPEGPRPAGDLTSDRMLANLEWTPPRPGATPQSIPVTVSAAWSKATGHLLTRLRSGDSGWRVEVLAQLHAPGEIIDELQFSVPRDWPDAVDLEPAGQSHVEPLPGQSRNLLRVRLKEPAKDQLTVRMSTGVMEELELVHLPAIDLIGPHDLQRWVALPKTDRGARLQWQLAGLQARSDLPAPIAGEALANETVYEAIIDRYRAVARPERTRTELPRVVLADHEIVWQSDRRVVGKSEFTLLPGGARSLLIQPPDAHELIAVVVNDVPGVLRREPGISGAASVDLHSDSWPQWVQVIYSGRLPVAADQGGSWEFAAPRLAGVPVDRTRWRIAGPERLLAEQSIAANLQPADELLAPLESLAKIARGVGEVPGGNLAESTDTWLRHWRRHWDREFGTLQKQNSAAIREPAVTQRLATLLEELADLLSTPIVEEPGSSARTSDTGLSPFTDIAASRSVFELQMLQPGDASAWKVRLAFEPETPSQRWNWLTAFSLIAGALALSPALHSAAIRDWLVTYPQLVLSLTACAMLIVPGYLWLGVLLLSFTLLLTLHSPWRQRA